MAENVASRVIEEMQSTTDADLRAITETLKEVQQKLDKIEKRLTDPRTARILPLRQFQHVPDASQDRFTIDEAVSDEINQFFQKEKACTFEPNAKPCDHCGMCSARGF